MGGSVDVAGLNGEELVKKLQNDFASAENYEYLVQRVTKVENYIGDITSKVRISEFFFQIVKILFRLTQLL